MQNKLTSIAMPFAVKPANAVTSIKQSPVFKGHIFLSSHKSYQISYEKILF